MTDETVPRAEKTKRELVLLAMPDKPISQMSDAERHRFAELLVDRMFAAMGMASERGPRPRP